MLAGFGVALAVALVLPKVDGGGRGSPPIGLLVSAGALIAAATMVALWFAIRRDLGLPQRTAVYAVGYMTLVVAVKFVLAPLAVYQMYRGAEIEEPFPIDKPVGAVLVGVLVLGLYLLAYWLVYRPFRRRLVPARHPGRRRAVPVAGVALPAIAFALLIAGTGGAFILLPLLFAGDGVEYVSYVFTSSVALLIVAFLVAATVLAFIAFRSVADRAQLVGDAAVLVSFFWLGLFFLVLYHVLWVVYMLVLFSLWPLKMVVPK
jgi:hypothetical protein